MRKQCGVRTLLVMLLVLPQGLLSCIPAREDNRSPQNIPRTAETTSVQAPLSGPTTATDPGSESTVPLGPGQSYEDAKRRGLVNDEYAVHVDGSAVRKVGDDRKATLQFTVTNAGKRDDAYRVEVLPAGVVLLAGPVETLALSAGRSATVPVTVRLLVNGAEPSVLFRVSSTTGSNAVDETTVTQF